MKLVVGLGNPGARYRGTRHNVGFEVVDRLVSRHGLRVMPWRSLADTAEWRFAGDLVWLARPVTFMNLSGDAVSALMRFYKIDPLHLLVVCDDVNLPVGRLRARPDGSDGGNNGLASITAALGTDAYSRLRVGVGRGDPRRDLADHVLSRFFPEEVPVADAAMDRAADAVEVWLRDGLAPVMNRFNRAEEDPGSPGKQV